MIDNPTKQFVEGNISPLYLMFNRDTLNYIKDDITTLQRGIKYRDDKIESLKKEINNLSPDFQIKFSPVVSYSGNEGSYVVHQNVKPELSKMIFRSNTKEEAEKFIETCKKEWGI